MVDIHEELADAIAVIGAAGRFPKADSLEEFWAALRGGRNCTDTVSFEVLKAGGVPDAELDTDAYVTAMGRLDDVLSFDAALFRLSANDAELMDPQQRKFLECSYEALESAGYALDAPERRVAVYAAASHSSYLPSRLVGIGTARVAEALQMAIGNDRDYLATRISYILNLTGPSLTVQTACSSSLSAVHLACQSLLSGECDMALAGGVSITLPQSDGYRHREGLVLSRSGVCRPFDAAADGTVNGNGVGVVLLKPLTAALRDGDVIRAVIRGTAANNDGSDKVGYTAPSVRGEAAVVAEALAVSGVAAADIGFVSTHGTATAIGDPIEVDALTRAFDTAEVGFCTLGAVKANIGHLDAAAGIAGFFEAMLALEYKELPPVANFNTPNSGLRLGETPFVIRKKAAPWSSGRRFALANAFGFGGTNVSVVLEEAPATTCPATDDAKGPFILPLSARTPEALRVLIKEWQSYLETCGSPANACWTAACRRTHFACRAVAVGGNREELLHALEKELNGDVADAAASKARVKKPAVGAGFSGGNMLRALHDQFEAVREKVERRAADLSLAAEPALSQPEFCDRLLAELQEALGIDAQGEQCRLDEDASGPAGAFLSAVARAYRCGADIHWEALLTGKAVRIPATPFSAADYCHPLAQRRERLPLDPVTAAQSAATTLAVSSQYMLEPELLAERESLLEDLCSAAVARAFAHLGFMDGATAGEALEKMGIPPQFAQLTERLLDALHEKGLLRREGDRYRELAAVPEARFSELKENTGPVWEAWGAMETVLLSTADHLPELLQGRLDLREAFMPKGNLNSARRIYSELPNSTYFNSLIREYVREWLDRTASGEAVRIFEIGGGTAATTERILPLLPPDRASYMFTDVSPVFLRQAQARFSEYGFFQARVFNMEESPEKQGIEAGIYDIVIASNVLHAATDLTKAVRHAASLLRPGGLLLLYEITRANFLGEITTGLLLPNITDTAVRGLQPMASDELWEEILTGNDFERVLVLPENGSLAAALPDRVISAALRRRSGRAEVVLPAHCAYQTVWEKKHFKGGSAALGKILLVADDADVPLFEEIATERGLALQRIPADLAASDLQTWAGEEAVYTVLDARALSETEHSSDCGEQERLCGGLLSLLRAFMGANLAGAEWHWVSLTCGAARKLLHPQQSAFWGMNRVVGLGHPELDLKQFDLSGKTPETVRTLFDLLQSGSGEELNAVAKNEWLVPRLERCPIAELPLTGKVLDKEGWQVIVGGLGGIGLALAGDLAGQGFRRIALFSRHAPDAGEKDVLRALEKSGATVVVSQVDVADYKALDQAVSALQGQAAVRSIYHCAVVKRVRDADENDPWAAFWQILAPKVQGAWNLHRLAEAHRMQLDRMVFFSSSVSVVPPYSLPHYVAANTYLDALAAWRHGQGLPALAVSWGAWRDIGTVSDPAQADHLRNGGLHSFSPAEGLALLNDLLAKDIPHLAVMRVEWSRLLRQYGHRVPSYFERFAGNAHSSTEVQQLSGGEQASHTPSARMEILPALRGAADEEERSALLEDWLKGRFAALLKISPDAIDHAANLFDLGMDSLMFIEMSDDLEKALGIKISPSGLLQDFSIAKIAEKLLPELRIGGEKKKDISSLFVPEPEKRYEPFALTDVQRAYWIGRRQEMVLGNNACQGYIEFDCENLDVERLEKAWLRLIDRHGTLRTVIGEDGLQRVLENVPSFQITVHDIADQSEKEQQKTLQGIRDRLSHKVHNTALWPLFDIEVSLLSGNLRRLHVLVDNVVMDGRSISIILAEWAALYHDPALSFPPEAASFRDYVSAVERYRKTAAYHEAEAYWEKEAKLLPPAPALPLGKDPATIEKPRFVRHNYRMAPHLWEALKQAARRHGVTASSLLLATYAEVLGLWSQEPALTVNSPVFTRLPFHPQINDVVGEFTSSVLIRCETGGTRSFIDKVKTVQQRVFDGVKFCQVSGIEVMRRRIRDGASADSVRMPVVFTSTFGLAKAVDTGFAASIEEFASLGREVFNISQTPQVWIDNHVHDREGTLGIYWDTVEEIFPAGMIGEMFATYCRALERLAVEEQAWADRTPVVWEEAQEAPLVAAAAPTLLHAGFLRSFTKHPERIAVIDADRVLSYEELFKKAASLAARLAALLPADQKEVPLVAVALPKGWRQAVAVLGILFARAAYVPVDHNWPHLRRRAVLDEARPAAVVTLKTETPEDWNGLELLSIEDGDEEYTEPEAFLQADPAKLAYVIFTSGTTGTPKGVMMNHSGAMVTIGEINRRFSVTEADRVLALSSLSFDLSVYDFFGLWAAGGSVVIPKEDEVRDPEAWSRLMEAHGVTLWDSVPMFWQMLLESGEMPGSLPRLVMLSGDRIPAGLPGKSLERFPGARLVSLGGATEAGIWSICHEISANDPQPGWQSIPYGLALQGQSFHVLHKDLRPCPEGVAGELYIGGAALALGYLHNEAKTAEHFISHPVTKERLYRTGDLGVRRDGGAIEFFGRTDSQVKVGGFRIELGDVEAALAAMPDTAISAVVLTKYHQLAAFVVPKDYANRPDAADIRMFLQERLPSYMVPPTIEVVERMPLTANGKVDRQKLADDLLPGTNRMPADARQSASPSETMLCDVWREVIGSPVAPGDNVFALGADSLSVVRVDAILKQRYGLKLPLQTVFDHPVVRAMAGALDMHIRKDVSTMRQVDSPDVLFCLGNAFGDGDCFHDLARYWPLGSIKTVSVFPQAEDSLDTHLERICRQISAAQPSGALRMMGYCAGGLLAWLAVGRLQQQGRVVDRLILVSSVPVPSGLHSEPSALEAVTQSVVGRSSPELIRSLRDVSAVLDGAEFPRVDGVPCALVEAQELAGDKKLLDFWSSRADSLYNVVATGRHADCMKRKQLLGWLGQVIDWYESDGEERHV